MACKAFVNHLNSLIACTPSIPRAFVHHFAVHSPLHGALHGPPLSGLQGLKITAKSLGFVASDAMLSRNFNCLPRLTFKYNLLAAAGSKLRGPELGLGLLPCSHEGYSIPYLKIAVCGGFLCVRCLLLPSELSHGATNTALLPRPLGRMCSMGLLCWHYEHVGVSARPLQWRFDGLGGHHTLTESEILIRVVLTSSALSRWSCGQMYCSHCVHPKIIVRNLMAA